MAAFHEETLRLLRRDLAATDKQHSHDVARRAKLPGNSRSTMADALDRRITAAVDVTRDLERLIAFAETVNRLHDEHTAGLHAGWPRRACDDCPDDAAAGA